MLTLLRTASNNEDFKTLVKQLDADLAIRDADDHPFYDQFNKIDTIKYVVVAFDENDLPVGCGAIKQFEPKVMEVKRMFDPIQERGKGIAGQILRELETWATELSNTKCILETGIKQPEAISLYKKSGYRFTENYGQYAGVEKSVCFGKLLNKNN
ncbi:citrate lyase synthetase [Aequorivita sublithincola DSM 14238]|uniref:Citrate lyase synthetase n=1 Tax=Aequorivita sublithincola (strain DSM 14238 / LMG 21431 / ACAM 643 / 9-3) TaxID=746697 RepID=I3YSZ1_AEQSU|nr:GNAT family N-acetyltransferase [Aequorivita sublithincola]AFL80109.1 citrate lyase synthetase [Aequorivita sublithincola DSM 14238]